MFFKRRTKSKDSSIGHAKPPWQNVIAVCTKCSGKIGAMEGDKTCLRIALKELAGELGLRERVRPVDISCLDLCPEGKITVAHFTARGHRIIDVESKIPPRRILEEFGYLKP
jgi:predicted metal-binding protein